MNAYKRIRQDMRRNEVELLAHLRKWKGDVTHTMGFGSAWRHAMDRLEAGGQVVFQTGRGRFRMGHYAAVKGARPVTPAVRHG